MMKQSPCTRYFGERRKQKWKRILIPLVLIIFIITATLMLGNGVDVKAVQEVLGHEHLNTTEIYTHIDNESLRVVAKANPLSRVKAQEKKED